MLSQPPEVQDRVREAFHELAAAYAQPDGGLAVPAVVKIGSGERR